MKRGYIKPIFLIVPNAKGSSVKVDTLNDGNYLHSIRNVNRPKNPVLLFKIQTLLSARLGMSGYLFLRVSLLNSGMA